MDVSLVQKKHRYDPPDPLKVGPPKAPKKKKQEKTTAASEDKPPKGRQEPCQQQVQLRHRQHEPRAPCDLPQPRKIDPWQLHFVGTPLYRLPLYTMYLYTTYLCLSTYRRIVYTYINICMYIYIYIYGICIALSLSLFLFRCVQN